tara:strand:+ start:490 stop:903 length:414 start_codon:yes stop_codon:yes gene_type:complete
MKKSPIKQIDVDSLANAAYEKWYAKNVQKKKNALEVKKFDDTYLQRDESLPVYDTKSTEKPTFVQRVKNFGANVKNFLDAHRNRAKKQSEIPMPTFGEDPKNPMHPARQETELPDDAWDVEASRKGAKKHYAKWAKK